MKATAAELLAVRDVGDCDHGDNDPADVPHQIPAVWHHSHVPATPPACPPATDAGRAALAAVRALCVRSPAPAARTAPLHLLVWQGTPELYRRMLAHAAGLPPGVVQTRDRDLTERDKVMLRSAVSDMRLCLAVLADL